jgi:hypothetical protein
METGQGVWEDVGAPWMGLSVGGARCPIHRPRSHLWAGLRQ